MVEKIGPAGLHDTPSQPHEESPQPEYTQRVEKDLDPRSPARQSPVTLRISNEERVALDILAAMKGVPISEVIREAVRPVLQPHMEPSA